jgi:hypothetical protein
MAGGRVIDGGTPEQVARWQPMSDAMWRWGALNAAG